MTWRLTPGGILTQSRKPIVTLLSTISPSTAAAAETVRIYLTRVSSGVTVTIGGSGATVTGGSYGLDGWVDVTVPAGTGTVDVAVTDPVHGSDTSTGGFTYSGGGGESPLGTEPIPGDSANDVLKLDQTFGAYADINALAAAVAAAQAGGDEYYIFGPPATIEEESIAGGNYRVTLLTLPGSQGNSPGALYHGNHSWGSTLHPAGSIAFFELTITIASDIVWGGGKWLKWFYMNYTGDRTQIGPYDAGGDGPCTWNMLADGVKPIYGALPAANGGPGVTTYNTLAACTTGTALRHTAQYSANTTQGVTTTGDVRYWIDGILKIWASSAGRDEVPSWVKSRAPGGGANDGNVDYSGATTSADAALQQMSDKTLTGFFWPDIYERIVSGAGTLDLSRIRFWYRTV